MVFGKATAHKGQVPPPPMQISLQCAFFLVYTVTIYHEQKHDVVLLFRFAHFFFGVVTHPSLASKRSRDEQDNGKDIRY